jgi:hypothetical protein
MASLDSAPSRARQRWQEALLLFSLPFLYLLWRAPSFDSFFSNTDHGFQLALGRQVLLGKLPYVDLFFYYGPLAAYTSAAGFYFTDGPLAEIVICCIGYALAAGFAGLAVRRHTSFFVSLLVVAAMLLLLSRFYKWYYWCFPALVLFLLDRSFSKPEAHRRHAVALGCAAGIAALYRLDLGLACAVLAGVVWVASALRLDPRRLRQLPSLVVAGLAPMSLWLLFLLSQGGAAAVRDYFRFTCEGAVSTVSLIHSPIPDVDWARPFSSRSQVALAFRVVPAIYVLCLVHCAVHLVRRRSEPERLLVLGAAALGGAGLYPQAMHASEQQHLLQTLALLPACLALISWDLLALRNLGLRLSVSACGLVLLFMLAQIRGGFDLGPLLEGPERKLENLARARWTKPLKPITVTESIALPGQTVLVLPRPGDAYPTQIYAWIHRPMAGIFSFYEAGFFTDDYWRLRNYREILRNPPAVVIAAPDVFRARGSGGAAYLPEIYAFVREHYTDVVLSENGWIVLRRGS